MKIGLSILMVAAFIGRADVLAADEPDPFAPIEFIAGHCWLGSQADSNWTEEHCYSWVYGGEFIHDRLTVTDPAGPSIYKGETIFSVRQDTRVVAYFYWSSDGATSTGEMRFGDDGVYFPEERYTASDGSEIVLRSVWHRDGDNAFLNRTEMLDGEEWKLHRSVRLVRQD